METEQHQSIAEKHPGYFLWRCTECERMIREEWPEGQLTVLRPGDREAVHSGFWIAPEYKRALEDRN